MERRAGREEKGQRPDTVVCRVRSAFADRRMGAPTVSLSSPVVVVVAVVAASDLTLPDDIRQNGHGKAIEIP